MTKAPNAYIHAADIKALVFDLGNVLIDIDFMGCVGYWSRRAHVPPATIIERFRIDQHYQAFERGQLSPADYFDILRRQLGLKLNDSEMAAGWNRIIRGEKPGIRACVLELKPYYPLYVLTNTNALHVVAFKAKHQGLLQHFSQVFISSAMGCRKPDAAVYERVIADLGLPAGQIVFMDDAPENVAGAHAVGMQALQVKEPDDIFRMAADLLDHRRP